jgi:secreted PhoX family phosphatase
VEQARASRRGFLFGGLAAAVTTGIVSVGLGPRAALAQSASPSALLGFAPIPISRDDTVVVPAGYKVQVFAPWGTPLLDGAPAYAPGAVTGAAQQMQVGTHHDGMHFYPIEGSSTDGLLVMNHEYIEPRFMHAVKWAGQELDGDTVVMTADGKRDDDEVLAEIAAHGVSIMRIQRGADGQWAMSPTRTTAASTA